MLALEVTETAAMRHADATALGLDLRKALRVRDRRLRHRLQFARMPQPVSAPHPQNRPIVCRQHRILTYLRLADPRRSCSATLFRSKWSPKVSRDPPSCALCIVKAATKSGPDHSATRSGPEPNDAQPELADVRIHPAVCLRGRTERGGLVVGVNDRSRHLRVRMGVVVLGLDCDHVAHWLSPARVVRSSAEVAGAVVVRGADQPQAAFNGSRRWATRVVSAGTRQTSLAGLQADTASRLRSPAAPGRRRYRCQPSCSTKRRSSSARSR